MPIKHGLGYILGDEGSGSWFGRRLLAAHIYGILPEELERSFREKYQTGKEQAIHAVYHGKDPNVYLASFAPFLSEHRSHPMIQKLVLQGMTEFFETNVKSYPQCYSHPVHFVGSIAWNFRDTLKHIAREAGIQTGNIIQKPVHGLAQYFINGGKMP